MASVIKPRRGNSAPTTGLIQNEIAVDTTNKRIYVGNASGAGELIGSSPGGSNTHIQFNDSGNFGGDSGLTYNKTTDALTVSGDLAVNGGSITTSATGTAAIFNSNCTTLNIGQAATSLSIGAISGTTTINSSLLSVTQLSVTNSVGDEGGEMLFAKPATNTTIAGTGVVLDVYQNKLRFFEQGGDARGFYIDITSGSSGANTNLVGGGGGGAPGGSDTYVQFNDGGTTFGGDAGFTYNKTTDTLSVVKVGVNTSAPDKQLEINSATGECLRLTYNDSDGTASNYADMSVSSAGDLTISASGSDVVFASTSRIGINKTDPGYALDINSASGANLRLIYNSSSGTPTNYALFALSSSGDLTITPSGADVNMNANMDMSDYTLSRVELKDYCERSSSPAINTKTSTLTFDLSTAQVFSVSLNNNIGTVAVTNIPDNGNTNAVSFIVIFTADGTARSITWPVNFKWRNGKTPLLTSVNGEKEVLKFITTDAGTTWTAFRLTETPQEDIISCYINSDPDLISTGVKAFRPVPYDCEVVAWYVVSDSSGTIQFDINSSSFASYPTTSSIVSTFNYPSLTAASKDSDESVSGWTQLNAGDIVEFEITSNTDVTNVGIYLKIRRIQ